MHGLMSIKVKWSIFVVIYAVTVFNSKFKCLRLNIIIDSIKTDNNLSNQNIYLRIGNVHVFNSYFYDNGEETEIDS